MNSRILFTVICGCLIFFHAGAQITGTYTVCAGAITTLADVADAGAGTWSSSNPAIATVDGGGDVTGISGGVVIISYSYTGGSGTTIDTGTITVTPIISSGIISTVAGTGVGGYSGDESAATSAEILDNSVSLDRYGNIYIAEYSNNRVRKIDLSGTITTVAGTGSAFSSGDGGLATAAGVYGPASVTVDTAGNIYISEQNSSKVRKVSTTGIISTFAGNGAYGYSGDGSAATSAELSAPSNIAIDSSGNIYIADFNAHVVRVVNTSGIISTFAGTGGSGYTGDGGPATTATFNFPYWVWVDNAGNLLISDVANNCVRRVNASGIIETIAGTGTAGYSGDGGAATAATLYHQGGMCTDRLGNIYIADQDNDRIRKIDTSGIISTLAGIGVDGYSGDGGAAYAAALYAPDDVAIDSAGNLYESEGARIRKITSFSNVITGLSSICVGDTTTLVDTTYGGAGIWSSSDPTIASVNEYGVLSGIMAGTVTVTYLISNNCGSAYATKQITVNAPPATAGMISGSGTICAGTSAILTATMISGVWSSSNVGIATVDAVGTVYGLNMGNDTITYTVTNSCGIAYTSFPIQIITTPSVGNIFGSDTMCISSSITLVDTSASLPGSWSSNVTAIATVNGSGMVTSITGTGTDSIKYTVANSCGTVAAVHAITVINNPAAVTVVTSTTYTVCAGTSVTYSAIPVNGGDAPTYQWQVDGMEEATSSTYTYTPADGDIITCTLTSNAECAVPAVATSTAIDMTVHPILTPSVNITASTSYSVCSGTFVTYSATATNGGLSPLFKWQKNGVNEIVAGTFTYEPVDGDVIRCILTSDYSCLSIDTAVSNSITMTIVPSTVPMVSIADGVTGSICSGAHVTYTATATNGGSSPGFKWKVNGINRGITDVFTYAPAESDIVTCTLISDAVCVVSDSSTSTPIIMSVSPSITPGVSVSASPSAEVCGSTTVTYSAIGSGGGASPAYVWYVNGTIVGTGGSYFYVPINGDVVSCELTSDAACASPAIAVSTGLTMTVSPTVNPEIVIVTVTGPTVTEIGDTVVFNSVVVNGGSLPRYQWFVNGVAIPGATSSTFSVDTFTASSDVYCVLTSDAPCAGDTSVASNTQVIQVSLGLNPLAIGNDIYLLPNPNKGSFTIKGNIGSINSDAIIDVTDMMGQVVYNAVTPVKQGSISAEIFMNSTLANGMYLLKLRCGSDVATFHFVLDK